MVYRTTEIKKIGGAFLAGAALLIISMFFQNLATGLSPFDWRIYCVPALFGGLAGAGWARKELTIFGLLAQRPHCPPALEPLLPICANCKKIRIPGKEPQYMESWNAIETYITRKTGTEFSHGICPECIKILYGNVYEKLDRIYLRSEPPEKRPHYLKA